LAWHRKKPSDTRSSVSPERLQAAITKGVKKSDAKCEGFIGVIVQRQTPKARFDADWSVKGVRFGKADRDKSGLALVTIVERMQREFSLAADVPGSAEKPDVIRIGRLIRGTSVWLLVRASAEGAKGEMTNGPDTVSREVSLFDPSRRVSDRGLVAPCSPRPRRIHP
jgi:hypothetical protein